MENLADHTPAMRVIDEAIEEYEQAMRAQIPGGSLTLVIHSMLVKAGYLQSDD